jgi:hypothetical protein
LNFNWSSREQAQVTVSYNNLANGDAFFNHGELADLPVNSDGSMPRCSVLVDNEYEPAIFSSVDGFCG